MVSWLEIAVIVPSDAAELIYALLDTLGCAGVAQSFSPDGTVRLVGYVPATEDATEKLVWLAEQLDYAVAHGWLSSSPQVTTRVLEAEEWEAPLREALQPLPVGRRFLIVLNDEPVDNPEGRLLLRLQSLGGFGTGHHPTTRMCLELLEESEIDGKRVLDVGTGSGILAIAAVHLNAATVVATDIDEVALEAAKLNAARNGVAERIRFIKSDLLRQVEGQFDVVLSNLLTPLIKDLAWQLQSHRVLAPDGVWIGSGVSTEGWAEVKPLLSKLGYQVLTEREAAGWVAFKACQKR